MLTVAIVQLYLLYGDTRVYKVQPSHYHFSASSDQEVEGLSTAKLALNDQGGVLDCELKTSDYPWPFCGVRIEFDEDPEFGISLKNYHTVRLDVDFVNLDDNSFPRMRFYLRNFNPSYSDPENEYTLKYNGLEYQPNSDQGVINIPIANLQVMTWWLADNNIGIEHSAPEFSNISRIEFASGSGNALGNYRLSINSIEFVGNYIEGETLMLLLLVLWVSLALVYSVAEIRRSRLLIVKEQNRQHHLKNLNRTLRAQNYEFAELAHRDALTGAMNRHAIRDWLNQNYSTDSATGGPLSVIYLDIDHFKTVNDKYGHSVGDDVLREFTLVVMGILKPSDRLVRWGGEEFVIFCQDANIDQAIGKAERIRHTIEQHIWVHGDQLTSSMGVAELKQERPIDMMARADEALYQAKHKGRNRVEVSL